MTRWLGTTFSRIFWMQFAAVIAAVLIAATVVYLLLNAILMTFERHALEDHAAAIAGALHPTPAGLQLSLSPDLKALYDNGYDGFAFTVIDQTGRPLFSSLHNGAALFPGDPRRRRPTFFERPHGAEASYGASFPTQRGGQAVWVQVRQNLDDPDVFVDDVVAQFLGRIGWLIAPIVVLLLVVDILIVRRALAPVREASKRAEAIDPARIDVRLPTGDLPSEILPLVTAANRAFDRLEAGFRVQRDFTADAAHELRTPLAILRLRVDTLGEHEAAKPLRADIDAMGRLVDQLLAIAELDGLAFSPDDRADLRAVCFEVVSVMAPLAIAAGLHLELQVGPEPIMVQGQPEALSRALRNLIENAIAHSPAGGSITVSANTDGVVSVADEGPGVPEQDKALIFQRFWRRDRQSSRGSGLGLSIVERIVLAHAGSIEISSTPQGGALFIMRFKPARPAGFPHHG